MLEGVFPLWYWDFQFSGVLTHAGYLSSLLSIWLVYLTPSIKYRALSAVLGRKKCWFSWQASNPECRRRRVGADMKTTSRDLAELNSQWGGGPSLRPGDATRTGEVALGVITKCWLCLKRHNIIIPGRDNGSTVTAKCQFRFRSRPPFRRTDCKLNAKPAFFAISTRAKRRVQFSDLRNALLIWFRWFFT